METTSIEFTVSGVCVVEGEPPCMCSASPGTSGSALRSRLDNFRGMGKLFGRARLGERAMLLPTGARTARYITSRTASRSICTAASRSPSSNFNRSSSISSAGYPARTAILTTISSTPSSRLGQVARAMSSTSGAPSLQRKATPNAPANSKSRAGISKIKVDGPVVEMDGGCCNGVRSMSRIAYALVSVSRRRDDPDQ